MRSYAYNLVFLLGSNKILICALEVTHRDVVVTDRSGGCVQITSRPAQVLHQESVVLPQALSIAQDCLDN